MKPCEIQALSLRLKLMRQIVCCNLRDAFNNSNPVFNQLVFVLLILEIKIFISSIPVSVIFNSFPPGKDLFPPEQCG